MRNEDILAHWRTRAEPTTQFEEHTLLAYNFQPATHAFLFQVGLPLQAAPFLSFSRYDTPTRGGFYPVQQQYDLAEFFARYIAIGSDGAGNPIVLNIQQQDRIWWRRCAACSCSSAATWRNAWLACGSANRWSR